jgi:hypothetical protein
MRARKAAGPASAVTDNEARDGDPLARRIATEATALRAPAQHLRGESAHLEGDRIRLGIAYRHLLVDIRAEHGPAAFTDAATTLAVSSAPNLCTGVGGAG